MVDDSKDVGVVVIGRNEGERLQRCLRSALAATDRIVYVDSGSTDGSVEHASSLGIDVLTLDTTVPFTAARARNTGYEQLVSLFPDLRFFQVVDGDCELDGAWIQAGHAFLQERSDAGVVCGRRRERHPTATVYNQLCDLEWDTPVGETRSCGGDALFRREAFEAAGGYDPAVIAGEEPELCVRIRAGGWKVHRLDHEMTLHDADMTSFGQFWRRALRAGHAYAQGAHLHGRGPERHGVRPARSALVWGLLLPGVALAAAWPSYGGSLLAYAGFWWLQWLRIVRRERKRGRTAELARLKARYTLIGKHPQALGVLKFHWRRVRRKRPTLIEYKRAPSEEA